MSQAKDPTLFQFSVLAYCQPKQSQKEMQHILEEAIRSSLHLDVPVERLQVELEAEAVHLDENGGFLWQGNLALVLDMAEDTAEADLGIEDFILSQDIKDSSGTCYEIRLDIGAVPHNVEEHDLFDRILDAAHNVSEHLDHSNHKRPPGWYTYPGGGYRFWNGKNWVGEAIDHPPDSNHPV